MAKTEFIQIEFPRQDYTIYLNASHLSKGNYTIKLTYKNKVIETVKFTV
ncbi:hypothetical protein [Gilvibacter sp.]